MALVFAVACTGSGTVAPGAGAAAVALEQAASGPRRDVPSALDNPTGAGLPEPSVDPARIISGGVPPDGIPAIDEPRFERADRVDWLEDREPVLTLTIEGETRAYPVQVMTWHEIVNDTVGGVPVVMTYCPLCNSALAYERTIEGTVFDFGVSGMLYQSSLVMYDRQTESLWSHFVGEGIAGVMTGTKLQPLAVSMIRWSDWVQAHPRGWVLSRETGFDRPYGRNPYVGYDRVNTDPFLFDGTLDPQLPPKTRVLGVVAEGDAVAVLADTLAAREVIALSVAREPLVAWSRPGIASALDTQLIEDGRSVHQTGVFEATLDGRELSFEASGEGFVDEQTGSRWDFLGRAVEGPLAGMELIAVPHVDTFWFAWAAFQPDTRIFGSPTPEAE